jgi:cytochrome c biogenesis protein CcdA
VSLVGSVSLSLAAVTGALSVLNPCGFPLLPAFLSFYVGTDDSQLPSAANRVAQGLQIGLLVTAGFLGVFTVIGLPITLGANAVARLIPWVGLGVGVLLVAVGAAVLAGRSIRLAHAPEMRREGRSRAAVVAFGAGYGLASLGCTLPLFLTLIAASLTSDGTASSLTVFAAFGAGMGVVMMALAVAAAFARHGLTRVLRRALRWLSRASGFMLMLAGGYLSYYWWRIKYGPTSTLSADPIVGRATRFTAEVQRWAQQRGGLILTVALIVVGAAVIAWRRRASPIDTQPVVADTPEHIS